MKGSLEGLVQPTCRVVPSRGLQELQPAANMNQSQNLKVGRYLYHDMPTASNHSLHAERRLERPCTYFLTFLKQTKP